MSNNDWFSLLKKKNENYYPKVFLEKYDFDKDIKKIYSNNSYYVDCNEEY